jgi:hypothetical protein
MSAAPYSPLAQRLRETATAMSRPDSHLRFVPPIDPGSATENGAGIGKIIHLPRVPDPRGNLTFIEGDRHVPFDIKRVYYLYDVPGGASRGGHGHRNLHQLVVAMAGSFDIILDNGEDAERFTLNRSYYGLHIPPMTWRELENFSSGAVCLVLASEHYDERDYFRDYDAFLHEAREGR